VPSASDANVAVRTTQAGWDPIVAGIRADALDCLQSTVALIADRAYGPGAHLALGRHWRFPAPGPDGTIGVQPSVQERMAQAADVLGFTVGGPYGPMDAAGLRDMADSEPAYVVAEAWDLEWLPYSRAEVRYRQMPHSFLLERTAGGYTLVDGYYADTEWGRARPMARTLSAAELDQAVRGEVQVIRMTPGAGLTAPARAAGIAGNAVAARRATPAIDAYAGIITARLDRPEGLERLILDIWHLTRERILHTAWLGDHQAATRTAAQAARWQQLAAHSYLMMRRAARGAVASSRLVSQMIQLLHDDAELMISLCDAATITAVVREALGSVLRLDVSQLDDTAALRSLEGFNSFRLVDVIDLTEARLGTEFPADADARDLADLAGLARLFARAAGSQP